MIALGLVEELQAGTYPMDFFESWPWAVFKYYVSYCQARYRRVSALAFVTEFIYSFSQALLFGTDHGAGRCQVTQGCDSSGIVTVALGTSPGYRSLPTEMLVCGLCSGGGFGMVLDKLQAEFQF